MAPEGWWGVVGLTAWALYLGGALAMELIWRPTQAHIPPGQINVLCQRMGARYRWFAAFALGLAGAGSFMSERVRLGEIDVTTRYGRTAVLLGLVWLALAVGLVTITYVAHPALHMRDPATMSPEERSAAREKVRLAIHRMDLLLRADIAGGAIAALLAASLPSGGLV